MVSLKYSQPTKSGFKASPCSQTFRGRSRPITAYRCGSCDWPAVFDVIVDVGTGGDLSLSNVSLFRFWGGTKIHYDSRNTIDGERRIQTVRRISW